MAVFSTLHANNDYSEVEVNVADLKKTAFASTRGLYRCVRRLFGLKNAQGTFQRATDVALSPVNLLYAWEYLKDIFVFLCSTSEHIPQIRQLLNLLKNAGVRLNLQCSFFTKNIDYIGHVIRLRKLGIASYTTDIIKNLKLRTNITNLRSFLCPRIVF